MDEQKISESVENDEPQFEDEFRSIYANNFLLEISELDFKILFGQIEQSFGKPYVEWRTAVTMPWPQVKMLIFYLRVNLAIFESVNGKIKIPVSLIPAAPTAPDDVETNTRSKANFALMQKLQRELWEEYMAAQPPQSPGGPLPSVESRKPEAKP